MLNVFDEILLSQVHEPPRKKVPKISSAKSESESSSDNDESVKGEIGVKGEIWKKEEMKEAKTLSMLAAKRERFEAQNGLLPKKEEIKGEVKGEISMAELAEVEQFLRRNVFRTLDPNQFYRIV